MLLPRGHHYFHSELFGCFRSSYKCHLLAPFRKKIIRASRINSMHSFRRVGSTLNSAVIDTGPSCGAEGDGRHLLAPPRRVRRALSEVLGVAGSTALFCPPPQVWVLRGAPLAMTQNPPAVNARLAGTKLENVVPLCSKSWYAQADRPFGASRLDVCRL